MFLRVFMASAGSGLLLGLAWAMIAGADAGSAAFITATSAGPAILAGALSAGQIARVGARAQPPWRRDAWARRGAGFGAVSGGAWLVLWFLAFNLPTGVPPLVVAGTFVVGAVAGGVIGLGVGLYCARRVGNRLAD